MICGVLEFYRIAMLATEKVRARLRMLTHVMFTNSTSDVDINTYN